MAIREEVIKLEKSIILLAMSQSATVVLYIAMNKFVQTLDKRLKLLASKEGPAIVAKKVRHDGVSSVSCHQ